MELKWLRPYFLGPKGENQYLLESLLTEAVRDHVYWRRNFHPQDAATIPARLDESPETRAGINRIHEEFRRLLAELKQSLPSFSPRYLGHMHSETFLPAIAAKFATTLYNPNNITGEIAPVTALQEIQVARQLAEMFGFDPEQAWGHLTSGGTVANYEGLRNCRSIKYYPIALREAAKNLGVDPWVEFLGKPLSECTSWELFNLTIEDVPRLLRVCTDQLEKGLKGTPTQWAKRLREEAQGHRIESLGMVDFHRRHADLQPPMVIASGSAHYSWLKAMKLLGFGGASLVTTKLDANMRMDADDLQHKLETARTRQIPVLAVVPVLGSTEFGAIDPVARVVALRDEQRHKGQDFAIHVDAAWGGYITSVLRGRRGQLISRAALRRKHRYFPSEAVYDAFAALPHADFITIDPHKQGYIPYNAGALICKSRSVKDLVAQDASYVFDESIQPGQDRDAQDARRLGMYTLEGSRSGTAAAAARMAHQILPLRRDGLGRVIAETIKATEYFYGLMEEANCCLGRDFRIFLPCTPDTNLVCFAINPRGNTDIEVMNAFTREVQSKLSVSAGLPQQSSPFMVSYTTLDLGAESPAAKGARERWRKIYGHDPSASERGGKLFLLRHTLMNPWLRYNDGGKNYIDRYWESLLQVVEDVGQRHLLPAVTQDRKAV